MVGVFAGLKWRLVSSRIRSASGAAKAWMIVGWCAVVLVLASLVLGFALLRTNPPVAHTTVVSLFTVQMVSWVLAPLVAFGIDETVDPAKFALLPLTTTTLQRGLLVSSLIGYLPVANIVVLVGAAIALSASWSLLPIALLCCAAQLVLCVVVSRAASAAMSGLMSGRRGRDLGMAVGSVLFLLYIGLTVVLNQTAGTAGSDALGNGISAIGRVLAWGPNGALASIPFDIHQGAWGRLGIAVVTAAAAMALGWWWWLRALAASLTTVPSTTEGSAPADRTHDGSAVANSLRGMVALMIERDRVLTWRDPMRRIPWIMVAALALLWPLLVIRGHGTLFAVAFPALTMGLQVGNQYGVEGTGIWLHMVAFADRTRARGEALGHAIFVLIPGTVIVVPAVFLHAIIRHDLHWVPAALGVCLALTTGAVAVTGYTSARLPYAMRQSRKSMFANSIPGQKGRTLGSTLASMLGGIVVAIPAIVLAVLSLTESLAFGWVALVIGPLCGVVAIVVMSSLTATTYLARTPDILATVAVGDRS